MAEDTTALFAPLAPGVVADTAWSSGALLPMATQTAWAQTKTPFSWSVLGKFAVLLLIALVLLLWLVPWQQTVSGKGVVTVFSPNERPQTMNAQIDGRLAELLVKEGDWVQQGQLIARLAEIKPKYMDPNQVDRLYGELNALDAKEAALNQMLAALSMQVGTQGQALAATAPAQALKIQQAQQKRQAASQKYTAAQQTLLTTELNLKRVSTLFTDGLRSQRDLELVTLDVAKAKADVQNAAAEVQIAEHSQGIAGFEQTKFVAESAAKQQEVQAKQAEALDKLASVQKERFKLQNDIANIETRAVQRELRAPVAGQITQFFSRGLGETLKAGEPLLVVTPKTADVAVALTVPDWQVPLITLGLPVRVQFSGFPALQFVGWPSAPMGTFAGRVAAIDMVDNGKNEYRLLVRPDIKAIKAGKETPWPIQQALHPGMQANGWVVVNTVPLWFEVWRLLNGFTPTVDPVTAMPSDELYTKEPKSLSKPGAAKPLGEKPAGLIKIWKEGKTRG